MKSWQPVLFGIAGLLLVFAVVRSAAIVTSSERPVIAAAADLDLGRVLVGHTRVASVVLANNGTADLLLFRVKGNCECSVARLPSKIILPGAEAPLEVAFTPKNAGKRKQQIVIRSNDPAHPVTVITITADVYDPPMSRPAAVRADYLSGAR